MSFADRNCFWVARLAFAAFLLLTSVYCLLVWVPFSYFGFIRNPLVSWLPAFVRWHGLAYGALLVAVAGTLVPDLRRPESGRSVIAFLAVNGCVAAYDGWVGGLAAIRPDLESYLWSMLSLFPLVWLAGVDLAGRGKFMSAERSASLNPAQTTLAAVFVAMGFAAAAVLRGAMEGSGLPARLMLVGFSASLCFHLAIFTAAGLIVMFIRWASGKTRWPGVLDFVVGRLVLWLAFAEVLRKMILPTISLEGAPANIFAAVVPLVGLLYASGISGRLAEPSPARVRRTAKPAAPLWAWAAGLSVLIACAYAIPFLLGSRDWDFVLQRLAVIAVWLVSLQMVRWSGVRMHGRAAALAVLLVVAGGAAGFLGFAKVSLYNPEPSPFWQGTLETYAGADISFKTAQDVLARPVDNQAYKRFYEFLKRNTNLGQDAKVGPVDVSLVANLQPIPGPKPNIFLFVIDSLRQDFVPPYNPEAAEYMPEMARFAEDSAVLKNAYTRYGGTALSEPAIWVGAMQLHKQYIEPFSPMNNLQKLLDAGGYQSYVSIDPILRTILRPDPSIVEMDTQLNQGSKLWSDLDFVQTLKELETRIDARQSNSDQTKPIFAYSQPQNVHTLTLERAKIKGGRKAVSVSELRRIDSAFGEFVAFLRQRGLYDNSIIIVTADHGDSYGEFGRYGHADFLFPEIIRIPLIVHLPPAMRKEFVWDERLPAFNADITPSLYYLLGYRPLRNDERFGRPLFTHTMEEQSAYLRDQYLIVSSYAPVYAILGGRGQSLFIVDAVNSKNYYYDLSADPRGAINHVTVQIRNENEALIRRDVGLIDELYGWHSTGGAN